MAGLGRYLKVRFGDAGPHRTVDINKEMEDNPNWLRGEVPLQRLDIERPYVACHSGGGDGTMIPLVDALGRPLAAGVEDDLVAFQSVEDIRRAPKPLSTVYEQTREAFDPLRGGTEGADWKASFEAKDPPRRLMRHFDIPSMLLGPRIRQSVTWPRRRGTTPRPS